MSTLNYLHFDCSEDDTGCVSFEAMASVVVSQWDALQAELLQILNWATHHYPGVQGPLVEDGDWDFDLQAHLESSNPLILEYVPEERDLYSHLLEDPLQRYNIVLTLSGTQGFAEALRERFALDDQ
jgi:hypothetical protein